MREVRRKHAELCKTDPERKLFHRVGPGFNYWKYLPNGGPLDTKYYAKKWDKPLKEVIEMFKSDGFSNIALEE